MSRLCLDTQLTLLWTTLTLCSEVNRPRLRNPGLLLPSCQWVTYALAQEHV